MAVRIRMKKMGRRHRPFYRICAMDVRTPRDGRVLEELGTYDPMVPDTDARAVLNGQRIKHWLSVGAKPSDKVKVLIEKYGPEGTHLDKQREALERLAQARRAPEPPRLPETTEQPEEAAAQIAESVETPEEAPAEQPAEEAPTEESGGEEKTE